MFGRSTDTNTTDISATKLHGLHEKFVLIIIEEATGIKEEIWRAMEGSIVRKNHRVVAIGNPTDNTSGFYQRCRPGTSWNVIHLDARNSPNYLHNDEDIIPGLATFDQVERMKVDYGGEASQGFLALVAGQFPDAKSNAVIPLHDLELANERWRAQRDNPPKDDKGVVLGVDVAGVGDDLTVISECRAGMCTPLKAFAKSGDELICGVLLGLVREYREKKTPIYAIGLDATAIGSGLYQRLSEMQRDGFLPATQQFNILPFNFGKAAYDVARYNLFKDQLWWEFRESIMAGTASVPNNNDAQSVCALPHQDNIDTQLSRAIYIYDNKGRIDVFDQRQQNDPRTSQMPLKSPDIAHSIIIAHMAWKLQGRAVAEQELPISAEGYVASQIDKYFKTVIQDFTKKMKLQTEPGRAKRRDNIW
jgi:hypothetical protein